MSLTQKQQSAVDNSNGYNLLCALPGSGKTHTLISIVEEILTTSNAHRICMLTFTNAAVKEMEERLSKRLSYRERKKVHVSTFHSLFTKQVKGKVPGTLLIGPAYYNFLDRVKRELGLTINLKDLASIVDSIGMKMNTSSCSDREMEIYNTYQRLKRINGKYDLNDAAKKSVSGMVTGEINRLNYTHFLADEFQDTDEIQFAWLAEHGRFGAKVTAVGDDDQSIYSWRGAKGYEIMVDFQKQFSPQLHILDTCFRCRPEILFAAQNMIEFNVDRIPKEMETSKASGGVVEIHEHKNNYDQFNKFLDSYKTYHGQWAILARTNKHLEKASFFLMSEDIPFSIPNEKSIWDTPQADFVLKFIYLVRYHQAGVKYLSEVLAYCGESEENIKHIVEMAYASGSINVLIFNESSDWSVSTQKIAQSISKWSENYSNSETILDVIIEMIDFLAEARGHQKKINIEKSLLNGLINFKGSWFHRMEQFVKELNSTKEKGDVNDGVVLSTFHGSKGLEFENVAIIDLIQGVSPSKQTKETDCEITFRKRMEEERRLVYVAMTRAMERLEIHTYTTASDPESGKLSKTEPSEFIEEILYEED